MTIDLTERTLADLPAAVLISVPHRYPRAGANGTDVTAIYQLPISTVANRRRRQRLIHTAF